MAPREDMLPPGWDDLDRYAAIPSGTRFSIVDCAPPLAEWSRLAAIHLLPLQSVLVFFPFFFSFPSCFFFFLLFVFLFFIVPSPFSFVSVLLEFDSLSATLNSISFHRTNDPR